MALALDKAHSLISNALTHLWCVIDAYQLLFHIFVEYLKLAKIVMIHIFGSIEEEQCFSLVYFLKNKVKIYLNPHLQLIIAMFFTLNNFSYVEFPLICEKMLREQMVEPNMSDSCNICFVLGFRDYKVLDVTNF